MSAGFSRAILGCLWGRTKLALAGLVLAACATTASALDPGRQLAQFHHQVFSPHGITTPIAITSLALGDDGYLWVGSSIGIYRFDGGAFELVTSLGGQSIQHLPVVFLYAEPDGGIWIGYGGGAGVGYYRDGRYVGLSPAQGWSLLESVAVGRDGVVWAVVNRRLVRVEHLTPKEVGAQAGMPDAAVREVVVDQAGTVWVSTTGTEDLMYLPRGEQRFRWIGQHVGSALLAAAPDGTMFLSGTSGLWAAVTRDGLPTKIVHVSPREFGRLLIDRDGGLLATTTGGLVGPAVRGNSSSATVGSGSQRMPRRAWRDRASSSAVVWTMLEDRDGDVWVASNAALERFRDSRFMPVRVPGSSFSFGVVAGRDGAVWASNWDSGLLKIEGHTKINTVGSVGPHVSCVYRDSAGTIWAAAPVGLWRSQDDRRFAKVPVPDSLLQPWVATMTLDATGSLWFAASSLVRGSPASGQWHEFTGVEVFGDRFLARAMMAGFVGPNLAGKREMRFFA